uniref:Ankycorbin-like n=1 Tax=Elaeis guineensis var. tenera TaxID=51953 RepID=A0A6I9QDD3_ELAGV|nr:ankycorbin-like [Elaeis guineensis]
MNSCLKQDLAILCGFKISELKELLSTQILFNVASVRPLPKPSLESEESGPPLAGDFEIIWVHGGSLVALTTTGNREDQANQGLEEVILSLPTPSSSTAQPASPIVGPPSDEVTAEVVSASRATSATLRLKASALRDTRLASELLSVMLLLADANELLNISRKEMRKLTHYLNGYIESSHELMKQKKKFELEAGMLKGTKEKVESEAGEAFIRADTIDKRVEDAKATLRRAIEENSQFLRRIKELEVQLEAAEKKAAEAASKVGNYLANFVGSTLDDPSLELMMAREEVDLLKYQSEQMENKNGELTKELDSSEEALYEAREMIDRRDKKLSNREDQANQGLEEVILSLSTPSSSSAQPASPIVGPPSDEATAEAVSVSRATSATLRLKASALRDTRLASELLSRMLLLADANELLNISRKEMRKVAVNYLIWLTYYLNGYIESSHELMKEKKKFELEAGMLKGTKEKVEREAGEASIRVDTIDKRVEDAKAILRRAIEENSQFLGRIKELEIQLEATEKKAAKTAFKVVEDF